MALIVAIVAIPILIAVVAGIIYLIRLLCKALKKYIDSKEVRKEKDTVKKALREVLKEHRTQCKMTQEFVAESLGVSRQALSK